MPAPTTTTLEIGAIVTGLGGGLALFLFGMRQMTESLQTVAGNSMKAVLSRLTANRFTAALAGAIITGVIQSSSVTTVLVVGFVSAGLLQLSQSIGVIIGANVGTTITAQIIAFKIYKYGLLLIAIGFLLNILARRERQKQWGMALLGLGLIFFGMELMSSATVPLRAWPPFIDALQRVQHPFTGILAGMIFTAVVQSSSATTGIVIVLASQGLITLEAGIGTIFGANIGTCFTAVLSAFGRPREAIQAAWIHVLFNVGGVLLWMWFIPEFADLVRRLSLVTESIDGWEVDGAKTPRQIANAHTIFNLGNALLFIWFTGPLAKVVNWIVPKRSPPESLQPVYLDEYYLEQSALALDQVRRELVRLAELDQAVLQQAFRVVTSGTQADVEQLSRADDDVDTLHGAIVIYLGKLSQKNLVDPQSRQLYAYIGLANYLENMGDVIDNNLLDDAEKRLRLGATVSRSTTSVLQPLHEKVCWAFDRAIAALRGDDPIAASEAVESKEDVNLLADEATRHLAQRLVASEPNRLAAFQIETDIIENFKRLNTLTRRIARTVLELDQKKPRAESADDGLEAATINAEADPDAQNEGTP